MNLCASFEDSYGYGYVAATLARHMRDLDQPIKLWPLFGHRVPGDLQSLVGRGAAPDKYDVAMVAIATNPVGLRARALFTMYESTAMPREFAAGLARYDNLIVPTEFSRVAVAPYVPANRIYLCPLGADAPWSPPTFAPFTFTVVAADHNCPARKRVQEIVDAFSRVFPREPDVRLQIKRSVNCAPLHTFDRRISVVADRLERSAYEAWLGATTVGVQLSAMEGWSLPVNEFMAMGRPVILPLAGAMRDYVPPAACFPVRHKLRRAPREVFQGTGMVPYGDVNHMAAQMRFAYENRFEVLRRGLAAYEASTKYTTHTMGDRFLDVWQTIQNSRRARPAR